MNPRLLFFLLPIAAFNAGAAPSAWVHYDNTHSLVYSNDSLGNHIMDFSLAGYKGGGVALPTNGVVQTNLAAGTGDFTAKIQNAINYVGGLPPDTNGFRGVVLLGPGTFQVSNQINLDFSGVVLRGSGSGAGGTTLLMATNVNATNAIVPYTLLKIAGSGSRATSGTVNLTDAYVPSGAIAFNVSSAAGFNVGDTVVVNRTVTQAWLKYIGMDTNTLGGVWLSPGKVIYTDRVIQAINGNQITLDAPLTDSFDTNYLGSPCGTMQKYTWTTRPALVGVEHLRIQAPAIPAAYEPIWATSVVDAWLSDIFIQDGQNSCIIDRDCKRVTVDSVVTTHTCGVLGDPANLSCTGSQILLNNCQELGNTSWAFVTGANGCGPIAALNLYSESTSGISPHQRWTTGLLADNCRLPNAPQGAPGIAFWNRGLLGGGQGWCTGWSVAWNCVTPYYLLAAAPGTLDWVIGGTGLMVPIAEPPGIYDKFGSLVTPHSLYLAQLLQRLGAAAVENIGYPFFTISAPASVSVQRGTNVTFAVAVGDPSGFGNNVALNVSGLPAGAGVNWNTNSVTGAGNAWLTIMASNSVTPGIYTLNVIGTNSGLTHTSSVVLAMVNFALSADPTARSVPDGGTNTTYTISLTTNSSFSGSVSFGVSNLPAFTTASFNPASLSGAGSSTLTVTTTSNTPGGTCALTVTGTNGVAVGVVLLGLTVASPPYWTGAGSDGYWSDAANWNATPITPNADLLFDGGVQLNNTNDISPGTSYSSLTFGTGAGAFVLNGNAITLAGNITNNSGSQQTINLGLNFSTSQTLNGGGGMADGNIVGGLVVGGGLTNTLASGTAMLTLTGVGTLANQLGGGTNMIALSDAGAYWTLVDNAGSALISVPWSYAVNYGTFNFGTTNSAPMLTFLTVPANILANPVIGGSGLCPATFNMVNGTLTNGGLNTGIAGGATGNINMSGGAWSVSGEVQNANAPGGDGYFNFSGGTFTFSDKFYVANRGTGSLTIGGTGNVSGNILDVAHAYGTGSQGTVNLNGGTLAVNNVITDSGNAGSTNGSETATFNFNGGTLQARQNNAAFISQSGPGGPAAGSNIVLNLIVQSGGAVINSAGFNVTNLLALQHDATLGATPDGGLTKLGAGTLALTATNTYSGATTVTTGTLALSGAGSVATSAGISIGTGATFDVSGRTDGTLTLASGQTLSGSGTVNGQLLAGAGAVVSPGPGLMLLTVSSNVNLQGTTMIELNQTAGTNDVLKANGSMVYGGTLALTNLSGTLTNDTKFKLFSAVTYAGTFSNLAPVIPAINLAWNTNSLTNGTLGIVSSPTSPPHLGLLGMNGTNWIFSGTNGVPNWPCLLLASTNLTLPLNQWTAIATNTFDGLGNFSFTNSAGSNGLQTFYVLKLQ
jgi:autotransporter-associated beta strand protein